MNAQYCYIDPASQETRGPFDLEAIQALYEQGELDRTTMVCRVVVEEWRTFDAYSELLPQTVEPPAPKLAVPSVRRRVALATSVLVVVMVYVLAAVVGVTRWKAVPHSASAVVTTKTLSPTPSPYPLAPPEKNVERGTTIAQRVLKQYPKLKVAVISGISFPKPDGIELYGIGAFGVSISFILPEEAWDALSEDEKLDLQTYVAGKVAWVRDHAEEYMIVPRSAPDYEQDIERARHLVDGAWRIGSTQTYPDDPDGNLYFKRVLKKGSAY